MGLMGVMGVMGLMGEEGKGGLHDALGIHAVVVEDFSVSTVNDILIGDADDTNRYRVF